MDGPHAHCVRCPRGRERRPSPVECLVFEDAPHRIEGARRAGMRAVAITSTISADELGAAPHVIARAPDFTTLDAQALAAHLLA
jgi:beta-phosphoglucomutase-like phosphatase (HAD superfamily)